MNVELGDYLAGRASFLDQRLVSFARRLRRGDLIGVTLERDRLSVTPVKATTPEEARSLDRAIDSLLPRVRIPELLREIDALTGFTVMFRDLRSGRVHENQSCILAAVLADATNLGLERMANASQGVTYAQLAWTQSWYLSEENYRAALARSSRSITPNTSRDTGAMAKPRRPTVSSSGLAAGAAARARSTPYMGRSPACGFILTFPTCTAHSIRGCSRPRRRRRRTFLMD